MLGIAYVTLPKLIEKLRCRYNRIQLEYEIIENPELEEVLVVKNPEFNPEI